MTIILCWSLTESNWKKIRNICFIRSKNMIIWIFFLEIFLLFCFISILHCQFYYDNWDWNAAKWITQKAVHTRKDFNQPKKWGNAFCINALGKLILATRQQRYSNMETARLYLCHENCNCAHTLEHNQNERIKYFRLYKKEKKKSKN